MTRNLQLRKPKKSAEKVADDQAGLTAHLSRLGLKTVDEYLDWCSRSGFARIVHKSVTQRYQETHYAWQVAADAKLLQKKREERSFQSILAAIVAGKISEQQVSSPRLKLVCQTLSQSSASESVRKALYELLILLGESTSLIDSTNVVPQYGRQSQNSYLGALIALAYHHRSWIRKPKDWKPTSHNTARQFQSLARHLFAEWPVPSFMDSVWFLGLQADGLRKQEWFLHLARGANLRTADLPIPYSKRMAHHFMQAPNEYTVEEALRWGQIQALGGNPRLVKAVVSTSLRTNFANDEFWITVFQFLIENPMLDLAQVGPVVDYLTYQKFMPQNYVTAEGRIASRIPQPNLTMKGRSADALLRQVEAWHRSLNKGPRSATQWVPSGIRGLSYVEGSKQSDNEKLWTITELLSSKDLTYEGQKMRHCVASYARSCELGDCSIWKLELLTKEGLSKVLTLEVRNASKSLVQARGKFNALPSQRELKILERWASEAGLQIANWVKAE